MSKLVLKKEYQNVTISNSRLSDFNTVIITDSNMDFYIGKGFGFIFTEEVKSEKKK